MVSGSILIFCLFPIILAIIKAHFPLLQVHDCVYCCVVQGLNDRFAMFIDKVRHLEQQNKGLEMELASLRQRQSEPSRVAQLYQQELRDLRSQVEELSRDKNRFLIERNNVEDEFQVKPVRGVG